MRKNTVISLTATLLAANISFAVPAFADDLQTYNLDTMVVTAQRESKRDVDTPASLQPFPKSSLRKPVLLIFLMLCACKAVLLPTPMAAANPLAV